MTREHTAPSGQRPFKQMNGISCVICGNRRLLTINGCLVCFVSFFSFFNFNLSMSSFVTRFFLPSVCIRMSVCGERARYHHHTVSYLRIISPPYGVFVCTCVAVGATHTRTHTHAHNRRITKISHKIVKNKHEASVFRVGFRSSHSITFNLFAESF